MKHSTCILLALTVLLLFERHLRADTWCNNYSGAPTVFCDDFDRHCTSPPPEPQACTTDAERNDTALRSVWEWTSYNWNVLALDGVNMAIEDNTLFLSSAPYDGRHANGGDEGSRLGQNTVDLVPYIQEVTGHFYNAINGDNGLPITLRFDMSGGIQSANAIMYSNGYIELSLEDDNTGLVIDTSQAPTDFVMVGSSETEDCESCYAMCSGPEYSVHVPRPTICQQYNPRTADPDPCPPLQTFVRHTLGIGALAMLDNDPCHCDNPENQVPTNYHLSFFDGFKWRILKKGQFAGSGDFTLGDKINTVALTIKASTVDIYHKGRVDGTWIESWAYDVPRLYTGPFNRLRAGTKEACQLNSDSYTCWSGYSNGKKKPIRMGDTRCDNQSWQTNKSKFISFDNILLQGAYPPPPWGGCCLPDFTCIDTYPWWCESNGGQYQGDGTFCDTTECFLFADADHDNDVDQDDFGAFQLCCTGTGGGVPTGCEDFNQIHDEAEGIDKADFVKFHSCYTGPNVSYKTQLPDNCVPWPD